MSITMSLKAPELDDEDIQAIAVEMCRAINDETDVEANLPTEVGGPGVKGDPVTIGAIVLALITSGGLAKLFDVFKTAVDKNPKLSINLERNDGGILAINAEDLKSKNIGNTIDLARDFIPGAPREGGAS